MSTSDRETPDHEATDHDETTRRSFARQTGLFTGEDSIFASRSLSQVEWLAPIEPDSVVLDVACGAGHVAEEVAPHVRQVVGIDMTPELLRLAAERLGAAGIANVLLQEGDAASLPFVDASFDLVVCRSALHHFLRPALQLAEMARVCRPGGRVVVSDMVAPAGMRDAFDALHRRIDPSHASCLLEGEVAEIVGAAVGPVTRQTPPGSFAVPVGLILTDVADRDFVMTTLQAEIDGGPATGFEPVAGPDGEVLVTFGSTVVEATRVAS